MLLVLMHLALPKSHAGSFRLVVPCFVVQQVTVQPELATERRGKDVYSSNTLMASNNTIYMLSITLQTAPFARTGSIGWHVYHTPLQREPGAPHSKSQQCIAKPHMSYSFQLLVTSL
jgi:hypothetical protein